jgi:hypothetical protein
MSAAASEATIRLVYGGEAVDSGTMDVRDFAPALLALSELFDEADKLLSGPERDHAIQLRIKHNINHGSFDVTLLVVVQTLLHKILSLFGKDGHDLATLMEALGLVGGSGLIGLIALIRKLRNKQVVKVELTDSKARFVLQGDEVFVSRQTAQLYNDLGVRRALSAMFEPLRRDGIDSVSIKTPDGRAIETVTREELPAFDPPSPVETEPKKINTNEFEQAYTIVSLTFRDGNKWRLTDGQSTINVTIEDAGFLARVNSHDVNFAKDDVIRCKVRQEQFMTSEGLKTETFITRVLEHQHTYRQTVLPMDIAPVDPPKDPGPRAPKPKPAKKSAKKTAKKEAKPAKRNGRRGH